MEHEGAPDRFDSDVDNVPRAASARPRPRPKPGFVRGPTGPRARLVGMAEAPDDTLEPDAAEALAMAEARRRRGTDKWTRLGHQRSSRQEMREAAEDRFGCQFFVNGVEPPARATNAGSTPGPNVDAERRGRPRARSPSPLSLFVRFFWV